MSVTEVWLLMHHHDDDRLEGGVDDKILGVFASSDDANNALLSARTKDGFRDSLGGFEVIVLSVGEVIDPPGIRIKY